MGAGSPVVALAALVLFLPLGAWLFARLPRAQAAAAVVLAGSLFLPERVAWDFPAIPPLDKEYVTYLVCFVGAYLYRRRSLETALPGRGPEVLMLLMFIANLTTVLMNPEVVWDEGKLEPGLGVWTLVAQTGDDLLGIALPFFLGRALFTRREDLRTLLTLLALGGLAYTVLILVEVVLSIPFRVFQLSYLIYGIPMRPQWRWGVIQPVVFMDNGLAVATFMAGSLIAAMALVRTRGAVSGLPIPSSALVLFGLVMTRNIAGNVYGAVLALATRLIRPRALAGLALTLALFAVGYPALCIAKLFPDEALVEFASGFDAERGRSLEGRFLEEEHVLGLIGHRLWFGWGAFGRIPGAETFGEGEAGLDGWWIIRLGTNGLAGVVLHYAFFAWPVVSAWRRLRRFGKRDALLLASLMAIVGMRAVDLLINGWWNCLPVFLAGGLYSLARSPAETRAPAPPQAPSRAGGG